MQHPRRNKCLLDIQIKQLFTNPSLAGEREEALGTEESTLSKCFSLVSRIHAALSKINMFVPQRKKNNKLKD